MKTIVVMTLVACLVGCLEHPPIKTGFEGKKLPSFSFMLSDSLSHFSTDSIKSGSSFIVFYFSPYCPYCRAQIRDIVKNEESLKGVNFYFLTNYSCTEIRPMIKEFDLDRFKNITIAIDSSSAFVSYFYIPNIPYLAIYDKEKRLKQVYVGRTDIKKMKALL